MARIKFPGLLEYEKQISRLYAKTDHIIKSAVYDGADIVADAVRESLQAIPSVPDTHSLAAYQKEEPSFLNHSQKAGLLEGLGLSPMQNDNGYINTKLGFDGYNKIKTKRWPNGQPNVMIARSLESGSSAMHKNPFVRPTVYRVKNAAEKKMANTLDAEIKKIIK